MRSSAAASSTRSIALSGRNRSAIYRSDNFAAATIARIRNLDTVEHLVPFAQTAQNRNRLLDCRRLDQHRCEPTFERGVFFDMLAVLIERGRADKSDFPARQRRFEHVGGIHRAFGRSRADNRVHFVDEQQ